MIDWYDIDSVVGQNWYRLDPDFQDRVRRDCPPDDRTWADATLDGFGGLVGDRIARAADTIDAHPPELVRYDRWANEVGEIHHHPAMLDALGLEPWKVARLDEPVAAELGMKTWPHDDRRRWIEAMVAHPILIERPIVVADDGRAVLGRPPEAVQKLLS